MKLGPFGLGLSIGGVKHGNTIKITWKLRRIYP